MTRLLRFSLAALTLAAAAPLAFPVDARPRASGGVVHINRPANFAGAFTKPDVIVDGEAVATIGSGECFAVGLPAGRHKIIVRDQRSLLSAVDLELHAARISLGDGDEAFVTVRPLQEPAQFNDKATGYDLLVDDEGRRC